MVGGTMIKEWAELNKSFQDNIKKRETYKLGIQYLLELRKNIFDMVMMVSNNFPKEGFSIQIFPKPKGYASKTMGYSIYHIARIEDIVCHELISSDGQIFFKNGYQTLLNSNITTTGNELLEEEMVSFSKRLDIRKLIEYFKEVYESSNLGQ